MRFLTAALLALHGASGVGCVFKLKYLVDQPVRGAHPSGAIHAICALPIAVGCVEPLVCMALTAYSTSKWSLAAQLVLSLIPVFGSALNNDEGPQLPGLIALFRVVALLAFLLTPLSQFPHKAWEA